MKMEQKKYGVRTDGLWSLNDGKYLRPLIIEGLSYDCWESKTYSLTHSCICNPRRFKVIKKYGDGYILIKYEDIDYGKLEGTIASTIPTIGFGYITTPKQTEELLNNENQRIELNE